MNEITVNDLAQQTGYKVSTIQQLIQRGILSSRKDSSTHYLPAAESLLILTSHKPGEHWVKGRARPGKRKDNRLRWSDVL